MNYRLSFSIWEESFENNVEKLNTMMMIILRLDD